MEQIHLNWPMIVLVALGGISIVLGATGGVSMVDDASWQVSEAVVAPAISK